MRATTRVAQRDGGGALAAGPPVAQLPDGVRERLSDELIDELLAGARGEEEIVGPGGLLGDLTRRLVERAMDAELTGHLGYEHGQPPPGGAGNTRNGTTPKTLATEHGSVRIEVPRDRKGSFAPQIVAKGKRRFAGFDEKIIALYARGLSVRDIRAHLEGATVQRRACYLGRVAQARDDTATERDATAAQRDATAAQRDLAAYGRDRLANLSDRSGSAEQAVRRARGDRQRAEINREQAASDRDLAARDREQAASDHNQPADDRKQPATHDDPNMAIDRT
jgi:hypothetical protein